MLLQEKRDQLLQIYKTWEKELKETCPELITKEFSHPYYLHIPDDWFSKKTRILIVGEEGFGVKQFDMSITQAQAFNREYLLKQLSPGYDNTSPFWNRIRKIAALQDPAAFSITWTNLDKIHHSGRQRCALGKRKRIALHKTPTAILSEEIRLLGPTHIIYFGWYGVSLRAELPTEFAKLYPNGLGDCSEWKTEKMKDIQTDGIHHIFTYHPGWGQRVKGYEDKVLKMIADSFRG